MTAGRRFSEGYAPSIVTTVAEPAGVRAMLEECARQDRDIRSVLASPPPLVDRIVEAIRSSGRVLLSGMGASHHANHIAATRFCRRGVQAMAVPTSELLYAPLPQVERPVILVSQSGGSVEIGNWLDDVGDQGGIFGLTLYSSSMLARRVPSLVPSVPTEKAFAATRSFTLTLAVYTAILQRLASDEADGLPGEEPAVHPRLEEAFEALSDVSAFIVSARGSFTGMASMTALGLLELCRMPALAFEGGQLRHGPVEMLNARTGVIIFRSADASARAWESITGFCRDAQAPLIVFDTSGEAPLDGAITLDFPPGDGLEALFGLAPSQQALNIALACRYADRPGQPIYCGKVTSTE